MNYADLIICHLLEQEDFEDDEDIYKDIYKPLTPEEQATAQAELDQKTLRDKILAGRYRESQYVDAYLRRNHELGDGRGYTLGTYLAYNLRGERKNWAGRYKNALEIALERRVAAGLAKKGFSRLGGTAYYPLVL